MSVEAFILAGGGSTRFGSDKARAVVDGAPLMMHVATALRERYARVRVVSAAGRSYEDLGLATIFDARDDDGPLAGIEAALAACEAPFAAFAPCDLLGLRAAWYAPLEDAARAGGAAALYDDRWHPLTSVFDRALLATVTATLDRDERAVRALLDEVGTRVAPPADFATLRSINRREDLP